MIPLALRVLETPIGPLGVAWSARGLARVQLPSATREATERRLRAGASHALAAGAVDGAPGDPPWLASALAALLRHLGGEPQDLARIPLDLDGVPPFHRKVYEAALEVGPGTTVTYGELARRVGSPGAARAVGQALGRNPLAIVVPCHRVLAAGGRPGGFSAEGGPLTKARLLAIEGVTLDVGAAPLAATPRA